MSRIYRNEQGGCTWHGKSVSPEFLVERLIEQSRRNARPNLMGRASEMPKALWLRAERHLIALEAEYANALADEYAG